MSLLRPLDTNNIKGQFMFYLWEKQMIMTKEVQVNILAVKVNNEQF